MENEKLLNDDIVLEKPEDSLQNVSDNIESELLDTDSIKETEIVPEGEPKGLILNKDEYADQLRQKLNPQNEITNAPPGMETRQIGLDLSTETSEQRRKLNKENLKLKLQEILVQLEEMDELDDLIEQIPVENVETSSNKSITEDGIPTAAAIAGPGTTTDGIAQYKEKIGNFSMFKRKKH